MDINIPAWLAQVLIFGKFAVYLVSLYMFVRAIARHEIALAAPPTKPARRKPLSDTHPAWLAARNAPFEPETEQEKEQMKIAKGDPS